MKQWKWTLKSDGFASRYMLTLGTIYWFLVRSALFALVVLIGAVQILHPTSPLHRNAAHVISALVAFAIDNWQTTLTALVIGPTMAALTDENT